LLVQSVLMPHFARSAKSIRGGLGGAVAPQRGQGAAPLVGFGATPRVLTNKEDYITWLGNR